MDTITQSDAETYYPASRLLTVQGTSWEFYASFGIGIFMGVMLTLLGVSVLF